MLETFPAKRLLTPVRCSESDFFRTDYICNLYRGCNHGCIYCDSRSECYRIERFDTVRVKQDALVMLEDELRRKRAPGVVCMGATSDPYNYAEAEERVTRGALELLLKYGFGVGMSTKGDLVSRDAALLAQIHSRMSARVSFSITTTDDGLAQLIEPGAALPSKRFAAMAALADAGMFTGTWMNPMLPFITDNEYNLREVVRLTKACGGRFVICHFMVTLRTGDREYYYNALEKTPSLRGMKAKYIQRYGQQYECVVPDAERLYRILRSECEKLGLFWNFEAMNAASAVQSPRQLSFF